MVSPRTEIQTQNDYKMSPRTRKLFLENSILQNDNEILKQQFDSMFLKNAHLEFDNYLLRKLIDHKDDLLEELIDED